MLAAPSDVLRILDAAYAIDQPADAWLRGVLSALASDLDDGLGVSGYFVDVSHGARFWGLTAPDGPPPEQMLSSFARWQETMPLEFKRRMHLFAACGVGDFLQEDGFDRRQLDESNAANGFLDMAGINAIDASSQGCTFAAPLRKRSARQAPQVRRVWERVAAHIAAGARLLRERSGAPAQAVLTPEGRIEHAEGEARDRSAREALRRAAVGIDRARSRTKLEADEVTELWAALVAGRWSLVDRFEEGGRRYLVAVPNSPSVRGELPLTSRELQAARAAALGHSNKLIAYELGISASTVATLLSRAMRKLGAPNRAALIAAVGTG